MAWGLKSQTGNFRHNLFHRQTGADAKIPTAGHPDTPSSRRKITMSNRHLSFMKILTICVMCALSVHAQTPATPTVATPPSATTAAATAPVAPPAPAPRPYREIIKDTKEIPGYFTLHQKDEKLWISIQPDQFDKLFFFSYNIPQSLGERGLYGSQMGGSQIVSFHRVGTQIQLIAKNMRFFAAAGTPQSQTVSQSFSDSLIASATAASAPHPESKAVLVDASALLFADIPGYLTQLETAFRMPFTLDTRNTSFDHVVNSAGHTGIRVKAHFSVPKLSPPPLTPSPTPTPPPPTATPDPRSLFASFYYNFAELPAQPMRARVADERIGHLVSSRTDYTNDADVKQKKHIVKRWRLEKSDPAAAMSEPKQPIVYWLDKSIPEKYRASVAEGILEWNKAFERIGFKNAVVVKQQTEQDDFDTMDSRHASIRWFTGADVGFAIGPSHMDPRTGEILDADIATGDGFTRLGRRLAQQEWGKTEPLDRFAAHQQDPLNAHRTGGDQSAFLSCNYHEQGAHDFNYGMELLEARGMEFDSPEAEALAKASVRRNVMHEVGHTLGLRHNFRGSSIYSMKQLEDPEFTRKNGMAGSVMEYLAFNVAPMGAKQGDMINTTLGPYDYWAIEYAYREINPADEAAELAKIAARSTEPQLAYGDDYDAGIGAAGLGIDPAVNRFDLGNDPLEYYKRRMALNRELWQRAQNRKLKPGESYENLATSMSYGFRELAQVAPLAAKYIGGVTHYRDRAGTDRPLYEPIPAARQREALNLLSKDLFDTASFRFKPEFLSRIGIDHFDRPSNPDFSVASALLNVQSTMLDYLLSDAVAARLLSSAEKVADPSRLLTLSDLYDSLQSAIWSELKSGADIRSMRRNLQREHVKRIANALIRPAARTPADVGSLQRENAVQLSAQIRGAMGKPMSKEAKAHLADALNTLAEALKAPLQRAGA